MKIINGLEKKRKYYSIAAAAAAATATMLRVMMNKVDTAAVYLVQNTGMRRPHVREYATKQAESCDVPGIVYAMIRFPASLPVRLHSLHRRCGRSTYAYHILPIQTSPRS